MLPVLVGAVVLATVAVGMTISHKKKSEGDQSNSTSNTIVQAPSSSPVSVPTSSPTPVSQAPAVSGGSAGTEQSGAESEQTEQSSDSAPGTTATTGETSPTEKPANTASSEQASVPAVTWHTIGYWEGDSRTGKDRFEPDTSERIEQEKRMLSRRDARRPAGENPSSVWQGSAARYMNTQTFQIPSNDWRISWQFDEAGGAGEFQLKLFAFMNANTRPRLVRQVLYGGYDPRGHAFGGHFALSQTGSLDLHGAGTYLLSIWSGGPGYKITVEAKS